MEVKQLYLKEASLEYFNFINKNKCNYKNVLLNTIEINPQKIN